MSRPLPGLVPPEIGSQPSLGALLDEALRTHPSELALVELSRRREVGRWTYRGFRRQAGRVAARMEAAGIGAGDRVAICASNQPSWLFTAFAALVRGAVLVPLDHKLSATEQRALLDHARPALCVVEYGLWRRFDPAPDLPTWVIEAPDTAELPDGVERFEDLPERAHYTPVPRTRADQATLVYSSGTGGRPKGCVLSHGAYLAQLQALLEVFPMAPGDRYFSILPTNHAIDFMCGFVGPLVCGAAVVHQRTLRPELIRWSMQEMEITHMAVVPAILEGFAAAVRERLETLEGWRRTAFDLARATHARLVRRGPRPALSRRWMAPVHAAFGGALRLVFCGGAPTRRETAEFLYALGIPVVIGYGLTEACTVCTVHRLHPWRADGVGAPVAGVEIRIADPGPDGVGEVLVRGPTLMDGYLDEPELTARTLADGWLHTGDLGWMDASEHLHLVGRSKNMIVTAGGKNVYPEDVEQLLGEIPCEELVIYAGTYLFPRARLEYGELLAVVRPAEGDRSWAEALRRRNRALPEHKRIGGVIAWTEPFPRTASMKIRREELAGRLRAALDRDAIRPLLDLAVS